MASGGVLLSTTGGGLTVMTGGGEGGDGTVILSGTAAARSTEGADTGGCTAWVSTESSTSEPSALSSDGLSTGCGAFAGRSFCLVGGGVACEPRSSSTVG